MRIIVNGREVPDIQGLGEAFSQQQLSHAWLEASEVGPSLLVLTNGQRALLLYLRHKDGDTGFTSRHQAYTGPVNAMVEYELDNGQHDEYPADWAVPLEQAIATCQVFIETAGQRSPDILWHDDAMAEE